MVDFRLPIAMGATRQIFVELSGYGERGDDLNCRKIHQTFFPGAPKSTAEQVIFEIHDGEVSPAANAGRAQASNP
jgi:hypothetical protein